MNGRSVAELASQLESLAGSYVSPFVLFAAVELRLFDALVEPLRVGDLAERVGATTDGVRRLCRVLASMGLLSMTRDHVEAAPEARAVLSTNGALSIVPLALHHHRLVAPLFAELATAVRTGAPQYAAWRFAEPPVAGSAYAELVRHPAELETFVSAMDAASAGVGASLADELRELGVRRIVDLGCGGGRVAREILHAMPTITVESFDLPEVVEIARRSSAERGLDQRHMVREGNIVAGVDAAGADAVLLSAVLADWSEPERGRILAAAKRCLRPGGHLFVSETLLDDDRTGPPSAAMLSLVMLLASRGDQLSGEQARDELERAGFVDVRLRRGAPRDLMIARFPGSAAEGSST
jgi:SAM-dependent methyltransferase